jgi:hypothetical protein
MEYAMAPKLQAKDFMKRLAFALAEEAAKTTRQRGKIPD